MLVYPPGLLCWELCQFLNPPGERVSHLPAVPVLGLRSLTSVLVPLSPSPGKWAPSGVLSLEHSPESPIQREIVLLQGSGSSFPATNRAFTMGIHLFIRAGFIFMEKLLWAGVVLGESAGLLARARSCHCSCPGTRATNPWAGICVQSWVSVSPWLVYPVGCLHPAPADSIFLRKQPSMEQRALCF